MPAPAAELTLEVVAADGTPEPLTVRVYAPEPAAADWRCVVEFAGGVERRAEIHGLDSWQALTLAYKYVRTNLESAVGDGFRLTSFGEPVEVGAIFGEPNPPTAMRAYTGEDIIAVVVWHTNGRANYFLTLGKFYWQAEPAEIAAAVLAGCRGFALDGEPASAEVCYSLAEAAGAPYFFEGLHALSRVPLPDYRRLPRAEADQAAAAIHADLRAGHHVHYCGSGDAFHRYRRDRDRAAGGTAGGV